MAQASGMEGSAPIHVGRRKAKPARVVGMAALAAGLIAAGISAVVLARRAPPSTAAAEAPAAVPVVAAPVRQGDVPILLTGLGTVQALNRATIQSQVTGVLQTVDFTEGQTVRRGDKLAQIDPRPFQAQLDQAQGQLERDQAQLADSKVNLDRNVPLLNRGFASNQQVTDQRYQIAGLEGALKIDQAAIDNARTQLSYATLTAPFDGVTGLRMLDVGNVIRPTDAGGLVVITQVQPISVVFTLPTSQVAQVQDALSRGAVPAAVFDQAGTTQLDAGQLLAASNEANTSSGTVQFKAVFPNPQRRLWPGAFVNIELTVAVARNGLTVPTDAVQEGPNGEFVYVIGAGSKAEVRPVEVAQRVRGVALIRHGLNPGETVVSQGQYRLTSGILVQAAPPASVPDSSTATAGMLP